MWHWAALLCCEIKARVKDWFIQSELRQQDVIPANVPQW
jgi:hypothetical protein